jgi:AraC family transcriptional regulator
LGKSNLQFDSFSCGGGYANRVEAHKGGRGYDVLLHSSRWTNEGEGIFVSPMHCIELMLRPTPMRGAYAGRGANQFCKFGNVVFVPPNTPMSIRWQPGDHRALSCMFDPLTMGPLSRLDWDWSDLDLTATFDLRESRIALALQRLADEALSPSLASDIYVECLLMALAAEARRYFETRYVGEIEERGKLSAKQVADLRERVESNWSSPPQIVDLAREMGMRPRQLAAMYRNLTGNTLRSYLADCRIARAQNLLLDRTTLIKEVAFFTGFCSSASFAAAFRKSTGVTPLEFRESAGLRAC